MNALPIEPNVLVNPLNALLISSGLMLAMFLAKSAAFSEAPSKSRLIKSPLIAPKLFDTASNFEPVAKIATCSLASLIWSLSLPACCASSAIVSASPALAICPCKSLSSALMAAMPPSFKGISTSFMLWLVISYF